MPDAIDVSPRQIQETVTALAVNCRTPEVQRPVRRGHDADVEVPSSPGSVAGNEVTRLPSNLDTDTDVVERVAVGITEPPARKIEPLDDNPHTLSLPRPHPGTQ
jgi:hypothetical protein